MCLVFPSPLKVVRSTLLLIPFSSLSLIPRWCELFTSGPQIEMYYQLLVLIFAICRSRTVPGTFTAILLLLLSCPASNTVGAVESPLEIIRKEMRTIGSKINTFKGRISSRERATRLYFSFHFTPFKRLSVSSIGNSFSRVGILIRLVVFLNLLCRVFN